MKERKKKKKENCNVLYTIKANKKESNTMV